MTKKSLLGKRGEEIAKEYLEKNGYKILETNFRTKIGEIDIIAKEKEEIVFIEVKTRTSNLFGEPIEAISPKKLESIKRTTQYYLNKNNLNNAPIRIDAIEIIIKEKIILKQTKAII